VAMKVAVKKWLARVMRLRVLRLPMVRGENVVGEDAVAAVQIASPASRRVSRAAARRPPTMRCKAIRMQMVPRLG
jgi:hypothetical protein